MGLVYSLIEYINVNPIVYTQPLHIGILDIDVSATQHAATGLREKYCSAMHIFRETIEVQKVLIK